MRRKYSAEFAEVVLSLAVIVLAVMLSFKADELSILYPILFGLAAVMCFVFALEAFFRRRKKGQKGRGILYSVIGLILLLITWLSAKVVL